MNRDLGMVLKIIPPCTSRMTMLSLTVKSDDITGGTRNMGTQGRLLAVDHER